MNFRNPKIVITLRTILGLFFIMSGVGGMLAGKDLKGVPEAMIPSMKVFMQTGIFYMIKVTEIVSGLMLVTGFLPALAAIFLAPVCIGVLVFHLRMSPESIGAGIFVTVLTSYMGYAYWDKYKALFQR